MNQPKINFDELEAELCRRSLYEFVITFWDVINPDDFVSNWHIEYICDQLQTIGLRVVLRKEKLYDLIINVPPGTSKSTICSIFFPVWLWVQDPSLKIISASYSDTLSTALSVKSRDVIRSDKFKRLFPEIISKQDSDNKTLYENTLGGSRVATSVGGSVTGMHGHLLIVDDLINPKKAASETERANCNSWFDSTLSTRKVDKALTPTIVIMQRLHEGDLTGHLLSKEGKKIKHICLPAELSDVVKPEECKEYYVDNLLDPVRLSKEILEDTIKDLGSYAYAGQFLQTPFPEGGGILKKDWFQIISVEEFTRNVFNNNSGSVFDIFIDSAYTANKSNDPTALLAGCSINNQLYISEITEQWLELPELLRFIPTFSQRNFANYKSRVIIEPKASGKSVVQALKESHLNVIEAPSPKDDKVTRVHGITAFLESGKCFLIGESKTPWIQKFLNQATMFPNGKHDDMIDCLCMAIVNAKKSKGKIIISF